MADLVAQDDVEAALLRPLTDLEAGFVTGLIAQASALLRTAMPAVDARIAKYPDPGGIDPDTVSAVLAQVIVRKIANPTGAASVSDGMGPFTSTRSFASAGKQYGGGGDLVVTADDLAQLVPVVSFAMPGTIHTRPKLQHPCETWRR